ncbi:hypothetical protein Mvan_1808 [Mycolicibacterium vanbaalenii PYR-1]|uniref:Uncharacterized protein n=1 Tax=Mycolicibacterium vanbaalenii (strain DSM 7251 / JCM 13017 / BCRC 16820 / KCTC 9966 / NRRL B-24157 / PYR-1) TaxID=350058 RepID=A1T630_MYCVP|nr:hypothetical protein Mvan_1808 [Mycolicibacterium vanbaalenii PYR-1]
MNSFRGICDQVFGKDKGHGSGDCGSVAWEAVRGLPRGDPSRTRQSCRRRRRAYAAQQRRRRREWDARDAPRTGRRGSATCRQLRRRIRNRCCSWSGTLLSHMAVVCVFRG